MTVAGLSEVEARVLDRISAADLVADATRLIEAGGENPGDTEQAGQEVLADLCRAAGGLPVLSEFLPGRPNLLRPVRQRRRTPAAVPRPLGRRAGRRGLGR